MFAWLSLAIFAILIAQVNAKCVMKGNCGGIDRFGAPLPCVADTTPSKLGGQRAIAQLSEICGSDFANQALCCSESQIEQLSTNLARIKPLISSCPACEQNFKTVFCEFTCSPQQDQFVEIVDTQLSYTDQLVPKEVNYFLSPEAGSGVYDSCANVKFNALNQRSMDLLGGGAQNYTAFFDFIGQARPMLGGSLFQINFPFELSDNFSWQNQSTYSCSEGELKCSCIDCDKSCPNTPHLEVPGQCTIGPLSCAHFTVVVTYMLIIVVCVLIYFKSRRKQREQSAIELQRLIQGDEDEDMDQPLNVYKPNVIICSWFSKQALFCARNPFFVILSAVIIICISCLGLSGLQFETDPFKLWVSPASDAAAQKSFYDSNFGGFYRTAQLFVTNQSGPILTNYEVINWLNSVETRISELESPLLGDKLEKFCLNPLGTSNSASGCVVESITSYGTTESNWQQQLPRCIAQPVLCLPKFGQPVNPDLIFGESETYMNTSTLITTWVNRNSQDEEYKYRVYQWEEAVEQFVNDVVYNEAKERNLSMSFNIESSIERELAKSGKGNLKIVILSYLGMFAYIFFQFRENFWLGFFGVGLVFASIVCSGGILGYMNFSVSLIAMEVIPFLVLAIGTDNIFLLVDRFGMVQNVQTSLVTAESQISSTVGSLGSSFVLSSCCQMATFALACFINMPAVRSLAVFALTTLVVNSIFQLTVFVSLMSLFPPQPVEDSASHESKGLDFFISTIYAPLILGRRARGIIAAVFVFLVSISLLMLPKIELGLDPKQSVPSTSFLSNYFDDVSQYLRVGPPAYFVVNETIESRDMQQKLCSRFTTCDTDSVANILNAQTKVANNYFVSSPPNSWIDDYFMWLNPQFTRCCVENGEVCYRNHDWEFDMTGFPEGAQFSHYMKKWLRQPASQMCPLAGKSGYGDAVYLSKHNGVTASTFRVQHSKLQTQKDYIEAYKSSQRVAEYISSKLGINVFSYSVFYPFFYQYSTIQVESIYFISASLALVLAISTVLLGSLRSGLVLVATLSSLAINIAGFMKVFGISLNALSLVNLVICIGIGVEFCVHIIKSYTFVPQTPSIGLRGHSKLNRTYNSLIGTGKVVVSGVIITKLLGTLLLFFSTLPIFKIYYFRMWLILIILASIHCLVLLPVLLSTIGGRAYLSLGEDNEHTNLNDI